MEQRIAACARPGTAAIAFSEQSHGYVPCSPGGNIDHHSNIAHSARDDPGDPQTSTVIIPFSTTRVLVPRNRFHGAATASPYFRVAYRPAPPPPSTPG